MRRARASPAAALAGLLLAACGTTWQTDRPVTPTSYHSSRAHIERTTGKLRRLVAVALTQQAPPICRDGSGTLAVDYEAAWPGAERYLVDDKGYDILRLDPTADEDWLLPEKNGALLRELADWSADGKADAPPGPLTLALLARLKTRGADGLLVFHDHRTCRMAQPAHRLSMGVLTIGMNEIPLLTDPTMRDVHSIYRVAIVETSSQQPVWRRTLDMYWRATADEFAYPKPRDTISVLFEDLEPAVPGLLTR